jgi:hypothetical protein
MIRRPLSLFLSIPEKNEKIICKKCKININAHFLWECRIPFQQRFEKKSGSLLGPLAQLVEQLTLNQLARGSSPRRPTIIKKGVTKRNPFF